MTARLGTPHRRRGYALTLIAAALVVAVAAPAAAGRSNAERMRGLVTQARYEHGLHDLGGDVALKELATRQARRMYEAHSIFHNEHIAEELNAMTHEWTWVGENVGMGPTLSDIEDAFMRSTSHKQNILSAEWNAMAFGVERDADGWLYVTQIFGHMT